MKRIYTRTGDNGTTGIHGGKRVSKTHPRIEANGLLDQLNVEIGVVRSFMPINHPWQEGLREIQMELMSVMSLVATPSEERALNPNKIAPDSITAMERLIDRITEDCGESEFFILPGGTQLSAMMHRARVAARNAERALWRLHDTDPVDDRIMKYVNRLSDLFFIMARHEMLHAGMEEERWKSFTYKRKQR